VGARRVFARTPDGRTLAVDLHADGHVVVTATGAGHDGESALDIPLALETHYAGHGRVRLTHDRRRTLAWVVDAGDARWVFLDGDVFVLDVDDRPPERRRRSRAAGGESLGAPMPATVVQILVEPGQAVRRGDPLLLLEAMKMELPLRAPHDAVIAAVCCARGDLVQPGTMLVELAAPENA
jgi:acetyl/propionyl-CoA carboxylase alpha subunit